MSNIPNEIKLREEVGINDVVNLVEQRDDYGESQARQSDRWWKRHNHRKRKKRNRGKSKHFAREDLDEIPLRHRTPYNRTEFFHRYGRIFEEDFWEDF